MICVPCREQRHLQCADMGRAIAAMQGKIPAMYPTASSWRDCQHDVPDLMPVQAG